MKAIRLEVTGGPDVLGLAEVAVPRPGEGQILISAEACGVNYGETMQRAGTYPLPLSLPATPGSEVAGTVEALGDGVTGFALGERVAALLIDERGAWASGGYAEYAVADAARTFKIAPDVDAASCLALLGQGLTAWFMLTEAAPVRPGDAVLVHAASGGVGSLAIQIAKMLGAGQVFGAAGSDAKRNMVRRLGAEPVDNRAEQWPQLVRAATGGRGVDIILDPVGGATTAASLGALGPFGELVFFGALSGAMPELAQADWAGVVFGNRSIRGFANMDHLADVAASRKAADTLMGHLASGRLVVEVARFPLAEAHEAHRAMEARETAGKVVLVP